MAVLLLKDGRALKRRGRLVLRERDDSALHWRFSVDTTDPVADMLSRIRNSTIARQDQVVMPASRLKMGIARILKEEGFVKDFEVVKDSQHRMMRLWLRYTGKKDPVLNGLKRVSKPGLRVYAKSAEIPRVQGGLGVAVVSTPRGLMTGQQARRQKVGGEVLCYVW